MNSMKYIDLRSDTVTKPTNAMREAMFKAPVGDDVFGDDFLINKLEKLVAEKMGKEAGVFVPSGTFSNQLALYTYCNHGDEVILDQDAHIVQHEAGASSIISSVQLFTLESDHGIWDLDKLKRVIKKRSLSTPQTRLICIENAYSGKALPISYMKDVYKIAKDNNVKVHLDGARIFNAATALNVDVLELAKHSDTVSVCLSKALGAPVGTVLVGSKEFVEEARLKRKQMGGGMRQIGILAAPAIIAVEEMSKRLKVDHENAKYMENLLKKIPNLTIDESQRDINIVFFDIEDERKYDLPEFLYKNGIKITDYEGMFRLVTHFDVTKDEVKKVIDLIQEYFS